MRWLWAAISVLMCLAMAPSAADACGVVVGFDGGSIGTAYEPPDQRPCWLVTVRRERDALRIDDVARGVGRTSSLAGGPFAIEVLAGTRVIAARAFTIRDRARYVVRVPFDAEATALRTVGGAETTFFALEDPSEGALVRMLSRPLR